METMAHAVVSNVVLAGLLALVIVAASRWLHRPALLHALWALVLLQLVTPPLLPLPVLPELASAPAAAVQPPIVEALLPRSPGLPAAGAPLPWLQLGLAVGLLGTAIILGLALIRARRFAALLREARPVPPRLGERTAVLAARLGLKQPPRVVQVPAHISPLLWPGTNGLALVLPQQLMATLTPEQQDTLLAHELAHVRRRDHWLRWLELGALAAFWWYPLTWWARRALRHAEERCCDEWVLRTLPGCGGDYARAIVKTVAFVSAAAVPLPQGATGAGHAHDLRERLRGILMSQRQPTRRFSRPVRIAGFLAAAASLAVFPTWAEKADESPGEAPRVAQHEARELELDAAIEALELEQLKLQQQRHELELQRMEFEIQRAAERQERERLQIEKHALEAQKEGHVEQAESLREQMRAMERRWNEERESQRMKLEQQYLLQLEKRERHEASRRGHEEQREKLEKEIRRVRETRREEQRAVRLEREVRREVERTRAADEREALRAEREHAREASKRARAEARDQARRAEREHRAEAAERSRDAARARRSEAKNRRIAELEVRLHAREAKLDGLQEQGQDTEALEQEIDELREQIRRATDDSQ